MIEVDYKTILIESGVAIQDSIEGVTESELHDLEDIFSVQLPISYKKFLLACGRKAGYLGSTLGLFYPLVKSLKQEFLDLIDEDGLSLQLPENAFIFSSFDGLVFDYFICDGTPDPMLFRVDESYGVIESRGITFTDYFFGLIKTCDFSKKLGGFRYYWNGKEVVKISI